MVKEQFSKLLLCCSYNAKSVGHILLPLILPLPFLDGGSLSCNKEIEAKVKISTQELRAIRKVQSSNLIILATL